MLVDAEEFGATRKEIMQAFEEKNIEARPTWKPMHLQPVFQQHRAYEGAVSEELFQKGICLPSGTNMTEDDLDRVVSVIRECAGS